MARPKSIVLTPAEKKALIPDVKTKLKAAKQAVKDLVAEAKQREKDFNAAVKEHGKRASAAEKALAGLRSQLDSLTA